MKVIQLRTINKLDEIVVKELKYSTIIDVAMKGDICILVVENVKGVLSEIQIRPQ